MITALITLLILALVLFIIYTVLGRFVQGTALMIIGLIFALIILLYALKLFGIVAL